MRKIRYAAASAYSMADSDAAPCYAAAKRYSAHGTYSSALRGFALRSARQRDALRAAELRHVDDDIFATPFSRVTLRRHATHTPCRVITPCLRLRCQPYATEASLCRPLFFATIARFSPFFTTRHYATYAAAMPRKMMLPLFFRRRRR